MDAYSVRYKDPSGRSLSRIYEDLQPAGLHRPVTTAWKYQHLQPTGTMRGPEQQQESRPASSKPHVGVIGAGIAGLRCADVLLQHGFRVTVIEARDRIGGRVHQQMLPNNRTVDMGPNWIHGTENNPILHIANTTGTVSGSWDTKTNLFDKSGNLFPLDEGERYTTIMWDIIQDAFKYSNENGGNIDPNRSLLDFFKERVAEKIPDTEEDYASKRDIVIELSAMWGAFVGSPVSRQSLKFFWLEECIEGENLFCAGTYQKILGFIADPVLAEAEILLGAKAEKICYRYEFGVEATVSLNDGRTLSFDEIVVTAPLGWLKQNQKAFEPALPNKLTKAIDSLGYGCLEKVYITFPKAFWYPMDTQGRKAEGFVQWLAPEYASSTNPGKWNQEVVELATLDKGLGHPTLLFYTYGDQSKYLVDQLATLPTQQEKDDFVFNFFKPYYSRLPNYSETDDDCKPVGSIATAWLHDELAGYGSYTNFQVGLEEADQDVQTLRTGMPNNSLYFAGEHAAPYVALGTTTGAYWSGETVAKRIAEFYGRPRRIYAV